MKVLSGEDTSCHVNDVNQLMSHGSWETLNTLRSLVSGRGVSAEGSTVAGATSHAGGSREAAGTSKAGETWGAWGSIVADAALDQLTDLFKTINNLIYPNLTLPYLTFRNLT